jgi:hypothetical protein
LFFKPYVFIGQLVDQCFSLYDEIANLTEVEKMFEGRHTPDIQKAPPDDWLPSMQRISILGG